MIIKKDYSRTYELILAELQEDGYMNMVQYLEKNPPRKVSGTLFSSDLSDSLIAAKQSIMPMLTELKLADLDSVRPHSNLRQLLNKKDEGKWFGTLKAMSITAPQKQTFEEETEYEGFNDDGNKCECSFDDCDQHAYWKNQQTGSQLCDEHFDMAVEEFGGSHGYMAWDCEKDEYYTYREDL
jgi:hypothetical protein